MKYVALLRGVNVGGKNKVPMVELKECLTKAGLKDVTAYIQSGNIIFSSEETDTTKLTSTVEAAIRKQFGFEVPVVILSQKQLQFVADHTPEDWLKDADWKYNYLFIKPPFKMDEVVAGIGELKPDIESVTPGVDVVYQSMSMKLYGRTTTGKLASKPIYKQITIRNHNTVTKLLALMNDN